MAFPLAAAVGARAEVRPTDRKAAFIEVASTAGRGDYGFFSLLEFGGRLFAGTYCGGGGEGNCDIFVSMPETGKMRSLKKQLRTGESVYVLAEFQGMLYANTENQGFIFRTADGKKWEIVFSQHGLSGGACRMGAGLAVFDGQLWASTTQVTPEMTRVFRSATGDPGSWTMDESFGTQKDIQIRELIVYDGRLYALGYDFGEECAAVFALTKGQPWKRTYFGGQALHRETLKNKRIIKALVWKESLWMTTSPWVGGNRVPPAGVSRWDGSSLTIVYSDPERFVGTGIMDFNNELFFVDTVNWNAKRGSAGLHASPSGEKGTWREIGSLPEPEAMDLAVFQGKLYVATRRTQGSGSVYRVEFSGDQAAPPAPPVP